MMLLAALYTHMRLRGLAAAWLAHSLAQTQQHAIEHPIAQLETVVRVALCKSILARAV
jgi:hypothetical protein